MNEPEVEPEVLPRRRKVAVDVLAAVFGIGSWITINGLWVELPLLVETLPEGWNLPSYLSVIIQVANIGPLLYGLARQCLPRGAHETPITYGVLGTGILATLLLAIFWNYTTTIGSTEHSTALLTLCFFVALVDCTSSVLFLPFMAHFRGIYLISYFVGEGFSGFVPSIVALIQGIGGNQECVNVTNENGTFDIIAVNPDPRFGVSAFFYVLFVMMMASTGAFACLNVLPLVKSELASEQALLLSNSTRRNAQSSAISSTVALSSPLSSSSVPKCLLVLMLCLQAWVCALSNGVLPSIQSYSCLPYGNMAYHITVTLASIANPIACFVAFFLPVRRASIICSLTAIGTSLSGVILLTAATSPSPPLAGTTGGEYFIVILWVLMTAVFSHVKVAVASVLRDGGNRALFLCGAVTQGGSFVGAVIMFLLVNVYKLFQGYYACG